MPRAQPADQLAEALAGVAGAVRRAPAGDRDRANAGRDQARVPGALAASRIGRIEHQRVQRVGMAEGVGLGEEGPVGVAVEGDPAEAQGPPDVVDVVGGRRGAVGAEPRSELLARRPESAIQSGAPAGGRGSPAARERPVPRMSTVTSSRRRSSEPKSFDVGAGGPRAGVAGSALDREDRPQRRPIAIVARDGPRTRSWSSRARDRGARTAP